MKKVIVRIVMVMILTVTALNFVNCAKPATDETAVDRTEIEKPGDQNGVDREEVEQPGNQGSN